MLLPIGIYWRIRFCVARSGVSCLLKRAPWVWWVAVPRWTTLQNKSPIPIRPLMVFQCFFTHSGSNIQTLIASFEAVFSDNDLKSTDWDLHKENTVVKEKTRWRIICMHYKFKFDHLKTGHVHFIFFDWRRLFQTMILSAQVFKRVQRRRKSNRLKSSLPCS